MNFEDYETLPTTDFTTHMTAGAIAGIMEHCIMYPLDSVKTRMQSLATTTGREGISETFLRMIRTEGLLRPIRGMSAMVLGAGPSHALYFGSYEHFKNLFISHTTTDRYHTVVCGAAGCISTVVHDAFMNPAEVVKQRMQMLHSPYKSLLACVAGIYRTEGGRAFYRSYTTQLTMNVPFQCIHFMLYELTQNITNPNRIYNPLAHMLSGALAGGVAAALTTPLDVCKTLLNTQQGVKTTGLLETVRKVYQLGGARGYFRGVQARVVYQMPSTMICWTTYEFFKYMLGHSPTPNDMRLIVAPILADDLSDAISSTNVPLASSKTGDTPGASEKVFDDGPDRLRSNNSNNLLPDKLVNVKPRELPSISGMGLYGTTVSFNTMHQRNQDVVESHPDDLTHGLDFRSSSRHSEWHNLVHT